MPIVGPKVSAGDGALCGALDGHTALDGHRPNIRRPLPHQLRLRPDLTGQSRCYAPLCHIVFEFHARSISDSLKPMQAVRSFRIISATLLIEQ